jgi:hypothetical protein
MVIAPPSTRSFSASLTCFRGFFSVAFKRQPNLSTRRFAISSRLNSSTPFDAGGSVTTDNGSELHKYDRSLPWVLLAASATRIANVRLAPSRCRGLRQAGPLMPGYGAIVLGALQIGIYKNEIICFKDWVFSCLLYFVICDFL